MDDQIQITEPVPDRQQMRGSTIYDWLSDSHPLIKKALLIIALGVAAFLTIKVSPVIAAIVFGVGLIGILVGHFAFHNAYFWNDSVILLAFSKEDITSLNLYIILEMILFRLGISLNLM